MFWIRYPKPSSVNINIQSSNEAVKNITVTNNLGVLVYQYEFSSKLFQFMLSKGLYHVQLSTAIKVKRHKVIIE
jgi:hypothetical protein